MDRSRAVEPDLPVRVAGDALHVRRVFGEAYREGDTSIIPVAKVIGGAGNGYGQGSMHKSDGPDSAGPERDASGGGGAFGVRAKPVGVYVVRGGQVSWQPALDLNRVILGGQIVGLLATLAIARAVRRRRR